MGCNTSCLQAPVRKSGMKIGGHVIVLHIHMYMYLGKFLPVSVFFSFPCVMFVSPRGNLPVHVILSISSVWATWPKTGLCEYRVLYSHAEWHSTQYLLVKVFVCSIIKVEECRREAAEGGVLRGWWCGGPGARSRA